MKDIWNELGDLVGEYNKIGFDDITDFEKFHYYSLVYNSTALEGSTLTELDTQLLLDDDITAKGKPMEHHLMVKDNYQALLLASKFAKSKELPSIKLLQDLNACNMKNTGQLVNSALGESDGSKGEFRLTQAFSEALGYYLAPLKIPSATGMFCNDIKSKMINGLSQIEAYRLSFAAHFNLVYIHPWSDGNKRTSRLFMNYIQAYYGVPLSKVYVEDSKEYLQVLKKSKETDNIDTFNEFMASQQVKFLDEKITEYNKEQKRSQSRGIRFLY